MAVLQDVNINVYAQPSEKRVRTFLALSQNENGRQICFRILGAPLPSNCSATFSGTKPDGTVYTTTGTVAGNFVIVQEDMQMTAVPGVWDATLDVVNGTHNIVTAIIRVMVERGTVAPGSVPSNSQLDGYVAQCKSYAEQARMEAYGSPLTAETKAQMTDHKRAYVYTGSEPNMVAGNWYYWNGSAWTSGGVYNAVAVQTDKTLTVQDKAADGKATGDALNALREDLNILSNDTIGEVKTPIALTANTRTATSNEAGLDFTQGAKSGYQTAIIDCQAGDVFDIYTNTQSTSYNSWAFYRLNDAETGHVRTTWGTGSDSVTRITAGIRDVKLVVNNNSTYIASPKVEKVAVNSTSLKNRVDSVEAIVAKNLNHIAFLRRGLLYSTTTKMITISAQQMLYDGKRASFSESKTIDISGVSNYFAIVYDKDTQAFSAVTSDFTLTDAQYLVGAFDARVPEKGFVFGDYTLNGFIRQNGVNPISTLGFENVASDWWIYPTAARYAGVRDKTYAGFINNTGVCGVIAYNNVTGHIERRNMYISNEVDEHNAPSVSVLSSGKVMAVFTRHAKTPCHVICISKGKESISEFDRYAIKSEHDAVTYSQVVDMGGVLYLFYRAHDYAEGTTSTAKYHWAYRTSTDGGVTWSDEVTWLTGDTVQYYMLARKYDDTHIKIFMQSNATLSETDIRLAFFDTENGKILDADMSTEIADLSTLSEPVSYTAFTIILAKTSTYKNRLLSVAEGTNLSFVCGRIASASNYVVYLYKYVNGSWTANTIPNVGASFGGGTNSTYINHAEVVDADNGTYTVVYAAQTESGWELRKVSVASTAGTPQVLASSNNKIIRPFKIVGGNSVIFTTGTWNDYTDYNQDFVIKPYV